jgi:hypothetical protein
VGDAVHLPVCVCVCVWIALADVIGGDVHRAARPRGACDQHGRERQDRVGPPQRDSDRQRQHPLWGRCGTLHIHTHVYCLLKRGCVGLCVRLCGGGLGPFTGSVGDGGCGALTWGGAGVQLRTRSRRTARRWPCQSRSSAAAKCTHRRSSTIPMAGPFWRAPLALARVAWHCVRMHACVSARAVVMLVRVLHG